MNRYILYCTESQTRKALELGAPICTTTEPLYNKIGCKDSLIKVEIGGNMFAARIPTAEQMIGWLEEQEGLIEFVFIKRWKEKRWVYNVFTENKPTTLYGVIDYSTRKEATLAAIDAALGYLSSNKK